MSLFDRVKSSGQKGGGGIAAAFGMPAKKPSASSAARSRSRSRSASASPRRGGGRAGAGHRGRSRSRSHSRSRSRSRSPSASGSGSDHYSDDDQHSSSAKSSARPSSSKQPHRSSRHGDRSSHSRSRSRSRSHSRDRSSSVRKPSRASVSKTAGIVNPRKAAAAAEASRVAAAQRKADVAAQAKKAATRSASNKARRSVPPPAAAAITSPSAARPSSAHPSQSQKQFASTSSAAMLRTAASPTRAGSASAATRSMAPLLPFPLSTCSSAACRAEMSLAYSTLQSHAEASATQAALVADLRAEVAMLRKQLQLYRMEGAPRDYKDSTLMIGNGLPSSAANLASPSASRQGSTLQRNGSQSSFDRDDAKQGAYGGGAGSGADRAIFTRQPSSSAAAGAPAFTRPASLFTKNDNDPEPRFQPPPGSRDSPSHRIASGRAFGGAGSERLDLSLSATGAMMQLQRSPSGRAHLMSSSAEFGGPGGLSGGERDDLVSDLNPHSSGVQRSGSLSSFDRRPSMERDREGGSSQMHLQLGATQDFSVNYGES